MLDWLISFLPGTIPPSAEDAILDVPDDVHALFWHRSELKNVLDENSGVLNKTQKEKLAKLDHDIRAAALLLVGAGKGMFHRYREGRYGPTHWWWYLEDMLQEENFAKPAIKVGKKYPTVKEDVGLLKVAEPREEYKRKSRSR